MCKYAYIVTVVPRVPTWYVVENKEVPGRNIIGVPPVRKYANYRILLFSHKYHESAARIKLTISELKDACSGEFTTNNMYICGILYKIIDAPEDL
jgi:hypothetical protein